MSVMKKNPTNKSLKEKFEIINDIKKCMANKEASKNFGVPKNTLSTLMKNKVKLFFALQETSSSTK